MLFVVKSPNIYQTNNSVHSLNTRQQDKLHVPSVRFSSIQKGVCYLSVKIFNQLPQSISKFHSSVHIFKTRTRNFLATNAFYSIEEFISTIHV
jgi:peroxiredoxin